jgi:ATP-dependent helicase/nuclease subunit A
MARKTDPSQLGLFDAPSASPAPDEPEGAEATAAEDQAGAAPAPAAEDRAGAAPAPPAEPPARRFREAELPDQGARARIVRELDTNLLVEAGAGSGKTTALVDRMVALVRTGTAEVDEIAAVTFTRKAAAELRQRFQTALERELADALASDDAALAGRLDTALRDIDRAFLGTIHAFCARLLRERPVEAGVDPGFEEVLGAEELRLRRVFWRAHLERMAGSGDPLIGELGSVGLTPSQLEGLFDELVANPDVEFPAEAQAPPSAEAVDAVRARLSALLDRGAALMPPEPAERGWDELQSRIRLLLFLRRVMDWEDRTVFLDLLGEEVHGRSYRAVQNRWPDGPAAKALCEEWGELRDGAVAEVLDRWWAHRYPIALRFAQRAADAFAEERRRTGRLNFQDLLMLAARLLRTHPRARDELGRRYRRLLVDEFQDTDPVQAEVLLLLASPPDDPWRDAVPRPGALFVVGDPKQSIYRFRRADITVYNRVRDRFRAFGDRLELVANFRSVPDIGRLVDGVFGEGGRFGPEATAYQAAFAPLRTRRLAETSAVPVAQYHIDPDGRSYAAAATDGASRLVPWIARQIEAGRSPGDFLILARQKAELATYARELETWRIPAQVTGAGVDRTEELQELLLLLEALSDPTDPVRVVAVLVGLLFGLDHDRLVDWVLDAGPERRRFDITTARPTDDSPVGRALHTLYRWWDRSRREPADVLIGRIVDETGLVPLAAARDLGELRAGSLRFALDALRVAALAGDTSVAAATEALRTALEADEAEAPLEPVRRGVARVMTLHQAKGLEAPVVVLAHPVASGDHPVTSHVERRPDGSAVGYLVVEQRETLYRSRVLARPPGWEEKEAEERRFEAAEQDRLLYVAATRAGEELVVGRIAGKEQKSPWAELYPWIEEHGQDLRLEPARPPEPAALERSADDLTRAVARLRDDRAERGRPGYVVRTATAVAKAGGGVGSSEAEPLTEPWPDPRDGPDPEYRGRSWGSVVHGALDAARRGIEGDELRRTCRSLLLEWERPVEAGQPVELEELLRLIDRVRGSDLWDRAQEAEVALSEVPFAFRHDGPRFHDPEAPEEGVPGILEGVVDLAFREADGWVIVDYKTDVGTDPDFPRRRAAYRRQVELYAAAWEEMTAEEVKERVLLFTARPDLEPEAW